MSIIRVKWHETGRNLRTGDIVLLHDKSPIKGRYQLGVVESAQKSEDGLVRSCQVGYKIPKEPSKVYYGEENWKNGRGKWISVSRSVQRLHLLLPVEEQDKPLTVEEDEAGSVVVVDDEKQEHGDPVETVQEPVKKRKLKEKWIFEK